MANSTDFQVTFCGGAACAAARQGNDSKASAAPSMRKPFIAVAVFIPDIFGITYQQCTTGSRPRKTSRIAATAAFDFIDAYGLAEYVSENRLGAREEHARWRLYAAQISLLGCIDGADLFPRPVQGAGKSLTAASGCERQPFGGWAAQAGCP